MSSSTSHIPPRNSMLSRFVGAILASVFTLGGAIADAQAQVGQTSSSNRGIQPLVTSQLFLADASLCEVSWNNYLSGPCPPGWSYHDRSWVSTVWAVSVTNPNKSATALNVQARVILLDVAGREVMNKVIQVAARLSPGQTTWLAPTGSILLDGNQFEVAADEGRGFAVSGSVTVLNHSWGRNSTANTVRVPLVLWVSPQCQNNVENGNCNLVQAGRAVLPKPWKYHSANQTVIFFGSDGSPIAGVRLNDGLAASITNGKLPLIGVFGDGRISVLLGVPKSFASRIAAVQLFISR